MPMVYWKNCLLSLWPYVGIKSSPNCTRVSQKVDTAVFYWSTSDWFQNYPKKSPHIRLILYEKLLPSALENIPIWSHCFLQIWFQAKYQHRRITFAEVSSPFTLTFLFFFESERRPNCVSKNVQSWTTSTGLMQSSFIHQGSYTTEGLCGRWNT